MSQLHRFLKSLGEEELRTVKTVRLIGKEQALFNYTLSYLQKEIPEPEEICTALEISSSHLYKINSVLLNKFYCALVPAGGIALLEYLKQKGHFVLLRSEASTQEKQLQKFKPGKKILEKFYLGLFHLFIDFPFKYYDKKQVLESGKKYLEAKEKKTLSDELYVQYHVLFADVNRCAASKNPTRSLGFDLKAEIKKEEELKKGKHFLALYYLYRAAASWYSYYEKDGKKKLFYLEKAMGLKEQIAWFFEIDIKSFLQLLFADALFMEGELERANKEYALAFKNGVEENMYGYYYFCEQYVLLKIIHKDIDGAKKMLDEVFSPCIAQGMDIFATRGALSYAKLFLASGELKEAIHYINVGFGINEKSFYLPFDIQLRLLETIYFIFKKDFEFSLKLSKRNLKFTEAQEEKKILTDYLKLWEDLSELARLKKKEKDLPDELKNSIAAFNTKYVNLYCGVMEKLVK
ncbi:MAG: hypothetical protein IAF38_00790 [Bacteroidia bacterium]|nr:hypothetical protein [Bacteroidia bacterium]